MNPDNEEKKKNPYDDYIFGFNVNLFTQKIEVRVANSPNTFYYNFDGKLVLEKKEKVYS